MMNEPGEVGLKKLFGQLAQEAKGKVPTFEHVWSKAQLKKRQRRKRSLYLRLTAAAIMVILVASMLISNGLEKNSVKAGEAIMTGWESPTEILLQRPQSFSMIEFEPLPTDVLLELSKRNQNAFN